MTVAATVAEVDVTAQQSLLLLVIEVQEEVVEHRLCRHGAHLPPHLPRQLQQHRLLRLAHLARNPRRRRRPSVWQNSRLGRRSTSRNRPQQPPLPLQLPRRLPHPRLQRLLQHLHQQQQPRQQQLLLMSRTPASSTQRPSLRNLLRDTTRLGCLDLSL